MHCSGAIDVPVTEITSQFVDCLEIESCVFLELSELRAMTYIDDRRSSPGVP